uniref:50S ribosomal protein L12, chloroplastic n=1 Tax=Sporolithon durum TaxID=48970 RepID=A0A141SD51_9FLOR|nr:ribosomal protein L12 [Sporolithon durum]AMK96219.1 ribosomal protein L12 [Sporolithon durum]
MITKIANIIEDLKSLTLLEAAELVKEIENVFNVDTSIISSGTIMSTDSSSLSNSSIAEEKTEFNVTLQVVPSAKKIAILKVVRSLTGLGLKEAKDLVESVPKILKESTSKEEAEEVKEKLEEVGAEAIIS